jgi:NADPH:quinone reductase
LAKMAKVKEQAILPVRVETGARAGSRREDEPHGRTRLSYSTKRTNETNRLSMKTWQIPQFTEPDQMAFTEAATPEPGEGQVLIRNRAAGVNFFDILQIQGKYQHKPTFPFTVGAEVAGVVERTGAGVTEVRQGDRVLAFTMSGGYAEFSLAPAWKTFRIPAEMSFPEAAALPIVYQTSHYALTQRGRLERGEWLLVHAGASGVGMAAIQLGKAFGARVIATAGSAEKLEFCRSVGADHAITYANQGWVEEVKQITAGRGADVIYDPVGGDVFDLSTRCIAPDGRLLVIGFASGRIPSIAANRILLKNIAIVGVFWGRQTEARPESLAESQAAIFELYRGGAVRPVVSRTYPLAEAQRALDDLAQRRVLGKAVLVMEG